MLNLEIKAMVRSPSGWLKPLFFFVLFSFLFLLGLGFDQAQLRMISPAVIWITFFVTSLNTIEPIIREDYHNGLLAQFCLSPFSLSQLILIKTFAIWLVASVPLIVLSPLMGAVMGLSLTQIEIMLIALLLGSPALALIGVLGTILTISLPSSGLFLSLLLLPLYIPILILGASAMQPGIDQWPLFQLCLLAGLSVLSITFIPFATASGLRASLD